MQYNRCGKGLERLMNSGDQIYKEACSHYERGELEEAIELFSRYINCFSKSCDNEKEIKAYYRGCTYYRLGVLYGKKQISGKSDENFKNALTCLEIASKSGVYKENGKLWFYKGVANCNLGRSKDSLQDFKEAAFYDYYDVEILKNIVPEDPHPLDCHQDDYQQKNLRNIFLLYYLKRYPQITKNYSNDPSHGKYLPNLINDYGLEGTYYCALSHYELKELIRSFKLFSKVTEGSNFDSSKEFCLISWYYKGIILSELKNGGNLDKIVRDLYGELCKQSKNADLSKNNQTNKLLKLKENKKIIDYRTWDLKKLKAFSECLLGKSTPGNKKTEMINNQRILDVNSLIAFNEALEIYNERINANKENSLYYEKALVLDELKRYNQAIESLDEFLKVYPTSAKAWLKKGIILSKLAKSEGIKITREEPKKEDREEKSTCEKEITKIEAAKNALEQSIRYFGILIDENPGNPDHWYNKGTARSSLAEVLVKTREYSNSVKEYEEAVKAFDNATTLSPIFALAWNNKGNAYLKLKKYNKAIEVFEKAYDINRNYYLALNNKGDALYSLGKYEEAIEIYKQVTGENDNKENSKKKEEDTAEKSRQINTVSYKSYNNKGLALYKLGRYDEAIKAFGEALHINPTFANGWTNKGLVFYKLEMFPEAKKAFEEALKIEPGNALASNNLGIVLAKEGEVGRAKKLFENTLQENPHFILGHANLAELLLNSGGIKEASGKIKDIIEDEKNPDPNMGYVYFLDGRIKIEDMENKENRYSEAAKSFEKAVSYNIEEPEYLLWLVYAKYLCQKFEPIGKRESHEESKTNKEDIQSKAEDKSSNQLFLLIISDLVKAFSFCSTPAIKKSSLLKIDNKKLLWDTIVTIVFLCGLFKLVNILRPDIRNFNNFQILDYPGLIIILLAASLILFKWELLWPTTITIISVFGLLYLTSCNIFVILVLIAIALAVLCKVLDKRLLWPILAVTMSFGLFCLFDSQRLIDPSKENLLLLIFMILLLLILLYEPILALVQYIGLKVFKLLKSKTPFRIKKYTKSIVDYLIERAEFCLIYQIKVKQYLIKFDRYKEIKAYTLYLLGYFYFKLQDYTTAKEKLQECINLRPDAKTDKAARELLANIWKYRIRPSFWSYWFNSPVKTWKRRAFGTFLIIGILSILFVHIEGPQPIALNNPPFNSSRPDQINFYPYVISYSPPNGTSSDTADSTTGRNNTGSENTSNGNNNTSWNFLIPASVNIFPDIPDNIFDSLLLLILTLTLISPSIRIKETIRVALKKGIADVSLDIEPIAAPPEFNFELSPSLMQDVIRRLDENL